jgi:hypothetical protein
MINPPAQATSPFQSQPFHGCAWIKTGPNLRPVQSASIFGEMPKNLGRKK